MKQNMKFLIATTLVVLVFASLAAPALAIRPVKNQTQYILDVGWKSSSDYWYVHVVQYGNKPATLQLSVYSQELGIDTFNVDKVLTQQDSFRWGARHTMLSVAFDYNGSPQRLVIDFWATEKPSRDSGVKGDWITAAGDAKITLNGDSNIEDISALVMSWNEPR
jgi:hypothetical protein